MNLKVCIDCGDLAESTRCPVCIGERDKRIGHQRGGSAARGYDKKWQRTAARVRREQPACVVCGTTDDLTVDHVIPTAKGGPDELSNKAPAHRACNRAKSDSLDFDTTTLKPPKVKRVRAY